MKNKDVILSGVFTGISGLFARMAMLKSDSGFALIYSLISNPFFWLSSLCGILGFAYLQISLHRDDLSFVQPAVSSVAIVTPIILAVIFLNEHVPVLRWMGVGLLLLGIIGIHKKEEKGLVKKLYTGIKRL
jgi:uncharacterized membrane protein